VIVSVLHAGHARGTVAPAVEVTLDKPQPVQTAGICLLVGGIFAILTSASVLLGTLCLWLPAVYGVVAGVMAVVAASRLMGDNAFGYGMPMAPAVMLIINVINFDMIGMVMGILVLVLLQDAAAKAYLDGVEILD